MKPSKKSALLWEFRLEDAQGIRVIDVARVVSGGPFHELPAVREHPPGSFSSSSNRPLATARRGSRRLGARGGAGPLDRQQDHQGAGRRSRHAARGVREDLPPGPHAAEALSRHREEPFTPDYQGKLCAAPIVADSRVHGRAPAAQKLRRPRVDRVLRGDRLQLCEKACPESAIDLAKKRAQILNEAAARPAALRASACPSAATLLVQEREELSTSLVTLPWRGAKPWVLGEFATILNRRGESLGSGR